MHSFLLACLLAAAAAAPQYSYPAPAAPPSSGYLAPQDSSEEAAEVIPILRDDRTHEEDGDFDVHVETGNGITFVKSGSNDGPEDSVVMQGSFSFSVRRCPE